jgi:hypothetical protein
MKYDFFREDLNLKSKWWHRLLSVLFILILVVSLVSSLVAYSSSDMFSGGDVQQWKKVESLYKRISSEILPIRSYIKTGEKIGENDRMYVLNDRPDSYYNGILSDVYCSTDLSKKFMDVKSSRNIDGLYINMSGTIGREEVSEQTFINFIEANDINCLTVDAYTETDGGKQTFIEPKRSYQEDWSFFEKSASLTALYYVKMTLSILAINLISILVTLVIYYKVILHIIFGSRKNSK